MSTVENKLHPDSIRAALTSFWNDALNITLTREGLTLALPQTGANGWQLVMEMKEITPGRVRLSDAGRALGELIARGQNIESPATAGHVNRILSQNGLSKEGLEVVRYMSIPIEPTEVHVMAEALSALTHLHVLHEPNVRAPDLADRTLRRVFADRQIDARAGATLEGHTEKQVRVDYYVPAARPVAFEILRRKGRLLPVMEQWGYRWQDLRKTNRHLMPVMVWDPAVQDMDDASRAIGEEVCDLFCPYDQTDRIHEVLEASSLYQVGEE